ncbi:hypothetical protein MFLAVUS_001836 [Mucor flavus]|uniref:Uncharacterized protein n=1 Tax=Mucor flavus TaxID=439312 RepID=A0ABP9YNL9_9FUNG
MEALNEDKASDLEKPFITYDSISELDKTHATLIKSICPIDVCAEIIDKGLLEWSKYMFEFNRISFGSNYILYNYSWNNNSDFINALDGAVLYLFDALRNSDLYSKPYTLSTEHSATSSSIFVNSKPNAIMNIDISLESTVLSFSLLDENGLVKEIWNHDYFVPDTRSSKKR